MKRVLGVLLAAFIGVGAFIGIANAQGPNSSECETANSDLGNARDALRDGVVADQAAARAFAADRALATAPPVVIVSLTATTSPASIPAKNVSSTDKSNVQAAITLASAIGSATAPQLAQLRLELAAIEAALALQVAAATDAIALQETADLTNVIELQAAIRVAQREADRVCAVVIPPTTTTVAPPPPTTTTIVPPPPPAFVDLDCIDFPLNGRTAQDVLNETPGEDPHNLDANGNRIACEVVADDNNNDNPPPPAQVIQIPVGGVATGDGSSL